MALMDVFVTDPVLKRVRRLREIEEEQKETYARIKQLRHKAWDLKRQYDALFHETKRLKKTGR